MSFKSFNEAFNWAMTYGKDNCRPCDRWLVVKIDEAYKVEIKFRASGQHVGFAV